MIIRPSAKLLLRQRSPAPLTRLHPRPPLSTILKCNILIPNSQTRSFLLSTPPVQTFSASRKISYPPPALFTVISDVNSYSAFVPFCVSSTVTETTPPPDNYPTKANLRVGWGSFDETFTSRLRCSRVDGGKELAGGVVEADATENSIFEVLRARWVIDSTATSAAAGDGKDSQVHLEIEYKFSNPLYAALSEAVMPKVAGKIIEAFERRAEDVLGNPRR